MDMSARVLMFTCPGRLTTYSTYLATIRIPEVHAMFQRAYDETVNHLETIEAEYAHSMGMVNDAEMGTYVRE